MLTLLWSKTPSFVKWLLLVALVGVLSFFAGAKLMPETVVDHQVVQVRDEEYTRQQVALARAEWERDTHTTSTTTVVVSKPCPPPTTEPYSCKPPCATDCSKCPSQTVSSTTTTTTDTHETGSSNSSTTTTDHGTSHSTETTHTTTTTKPPESSSSWGGLHLQGVASLNLLDSGKLALSPSYGIGLSKDLVGPLSISAMVYTDKSLTASLDLKLSERWSVSGGVASRIDDPLRISYGGSLDYRLFGPVSIGVWGYSDRTAGVSANISIP
jgi:hypothetical protein